MKVVQKSKSKLTKDGYSNLKILQPILLIKDLELKKFKQLQLILISPLNRIMEYIKKRVNPHREINYKGIKLMNSIITLCKRKVAAQ